MEHPCHRCGAAVDDGVAFCKQCNAPQIRVAGADAAAHTGPEAAPSPSALLAGTPQPGAIQWSQALPATALGGLIAAVAMATPLGVFGLGMLAAGALSVVFYRRRNPAANVTPAMGARLGAASGALGFGMFAILTSIEMMVFRSGGELRAALLDAVRQSAARSSDPQAQQMLEYLKTPQGLALVMVLGLIFIFVVFLIFSGLGGAIGAALLRRKERR
ncbi:MAG: hypothetical protein LAN83_11605 [Acidobacteriia bacterium]|nr:hypothetical protein [Terriglobia bacterium]